MNSSVPPASQPRSPEILHSIAEARAAVRAAQRAGQRTGLVPTMGALHLGHRSLIERSCRECNFTVVSIFVNPTQFAPHEDFRQYPRTLAGDVDLMAGLPVDVIFAPTVAEMYPLGFDTFVDPGAIAEPLEGRFRPTHFRGVATVVLKLFQCLPVDAAYFGQKDYQQALVIRRLVADLNVPITIEVCPIVREADGLALSSRNAYLSSADRRRATALSQALQAADRMAQAGERRTGPLLEAMRAVLEKVETIEIDYVAIVDPDTLREISTIDRRAVALIAARLGATRLIDNQILSVS
ncbi:MAG TPA: pantoate--beta-alanine ligase [Pirellulales bacterium]|jgi:pantoate--beta-alanine ligase|nr:pantoate--beta-alanine ligase [Pirellulales bacterium]